MPFVTGFLPSTHAPLFCNGPWPDGLALSVRIAGRPVLRLDATRWGLCGGMAYVTRDIFEAGAPQLNGCNPSRIGLSVAQHLLGRQVQSLARISTVGRWCAATLQPDDGPRLWGPGPAQATVSECSRIMGDIDAGRLCPIGIVVARSWPPRDLFENHVVLVWGYERDGDRLILHVYDSNLPGRDDLTIGLDLISRKGALPIATNATSGPRAGSIRGFFRLPYRYLDPSPAYL